MIANLRFRKLLLCSVLGMTVTPAAGAMALPKNFTVRPCQAALMNLETRSDPQGKWTAERLVAFRRFVTDLSQPGAHYRPFSSAEGIQTTSDLRSLARDQSAGILWSPDRAHFLLMTMSSNPEKRTSETTIWVYDSASIIQSARKGGDGIRCLALTYAFNASKPLPSAKFEDLRWSSDGKRVLFLAPTGSALQYDSKLQDPRSGHLEGFSFDVSKERVQQVTSVANPWGIAGFDYHLGQKMYFLAGPPADKAGYKWKVPIDIAASGGKIEGPLVRSFNDQLDSYLSKDRFFILRGGRLAPIKLGSSVPVISPTGKRAAVSTLDGQLAIMALDDLNSQPVPVGAKSRTYRLHQSVYWSSGDESVLLIYANKVGDAKPKGVGVYAYSLVSGQLETLVDDATAGWIYDVSSNSLDNSVTVKWRTGLGPTGPVLEVRKFRFDGAKWRQETVPGPGPDHPFLVKIEQDANTPPRVVAEVDSKKLVISPSDPALEGLPIARMRPFRWRDHLGVEREAGLILPASYKPGDRLPIVIEAYFNIPELFLPDGVSPSGDAAQLLAARGLAVLKVDTLLKSSTGESGTLEKGPELVRYFETLFDALVEQGFADPQRVGMQGFSQGGNQVYYLLAHPLRTRLGAAVVTDAGIESLEDTIFRAGMSGAPTYERQLSQVWSDPYFVLQRDTFFSVDRVASPALFFTHMNFGDADNPDFQTVGRAASFGVTKKPFEIQVLPQSNHGLTLSTGRVEELDAVADWMQFWLLGTEVADPAKKAQYERWRKLRDRVGIDGDKPNSLLRDGYLKTRAGLFYKILTRKVGNAPAPGDSVTFHYVAKASDGRVLANTRYGDKPLTIRLPPPPDLLPVGVVTPDRDVRPVAGLGMGWFQGLQLLHAGEKASLVMPGSLAVGVDGMSGLSPTDIVHVEIEVASVERAK